MDTQANDRVATEDGPEWSHRVCRVGKARTGRI